jgi:hypothetical protein
VAVTQRGIDQRSAKELGATNNQDPHHRRRLPYGPEDRRGFR